MVIYDTFASYLRRAMDCVASLAITMWVQRVRHDNATGNSRKPVQPSREKHFA
jgi:hypothetical protein